MKNNLYSISIEKEALRCNQDGKISVLNHPEIFGDKRKNKFITTSKIESQLKIATPMCEDVCECYIKLEELTDIVLYEIHDRDELLWPVTKPCEENEKKLPKSSIRVNFKINIDGLDKIASKIPNIERNIKKIYSNIKLEVEKNIAELEKTYGLINIEIDENGLHINNIVLDPYERCGISKESLMHLVLIIFAKMTEIEDLEKLNNILTLKCKDGVNISNIENRLEKLNNLQDEEILNMAKENMTIGYDERYRLKYYPKLLAEAAIIIKDALSQGIDYKILNEATSFVELNDNGHKEFVIEGNRTDRDTYIFPIVTDDKMISKNIMLEHGLNVPKAILLQKDMEQEEQDELLNEFYNTKVVVKPRNTNQGTGITVFNEPATKEQISKAIEYAFKFDQDVLIEEYVEGMEYRFLVVDGKCVSICHRRAASIVGDGKSTIKELVDAKNKEPWHDLTYTPVKLDEPVEIYLKTQGYTYSSIPEKNKRVFLRTNSNCSTGGESVDMTDAVPEYFKNIAEEASNIFKAKVAGVDLIIDDMNSKNYSIIEINDDPGYSINEWPYEGKGEKVGISILKLLGY